MAIYFLIQGREDEKKGKLYPLGVITLSNAEGYPKIEQIREKLEEFWNEEGDGDIEHFQERKNRPHEFEGFSVWCEYEDPDEETMRSVECLYFWLQEIPIY